MATDVLYSFLFYDEDWNAAYTTSEYVSASGRVGLNEAGYLHLEVFKDSFANEVLEVGYRVVMSRIPPFGSGDDHEFFLGELDRIEANEQRERSTISFIFSGALALLQRAVVAYPAGITNKSVFSTRPDFAIPLIISANLTAGSSVDRVRTSDLSTFTALSTVVTAPTSIEFRCAWRNVYDVVTELLDSNELDMDISAVPGGEYWSGSITDEYGTDKTGSVLLAKENGTIPQQSFTVESRDFKNVAIVGGSGQESDRETLARTGSTYDADLHSNEVFVDARQTSNVTELEAIGDAKLRQAERTRSYTVEVSQNRVHRFFKSDSTTSNFYYLGDTVSVMHDETLYSRRITGCDFSSDGSSPEKLKLTLEAV